MHECPSESDGDGVGDEVHDESAAAGKEDEYGDDEGYGEQGEEHIPEVTPDEYGVQREEGRLWVVADGIRPAAQAESKVCREAKVEEQHSAAGADANSTPVWVIRDRAGLVFRGAAASIIPVLVTPDVVALDEGLCLVAGIVADVPWRGFPDAGGAVAGAGDDAFAVVAEHG